MKEEQTCFERLQEIEGINEGEKLLQEFNNLIKDASMV